MNKLLEWALRLLYVAFMLGMCIIAFDGSQSDGNRAVAAVVFVAFQIRDEFQRQSKEIDRLAKKIDKTQEMLDEFNKR